MSMKTVDVTLRICYDDKESYHPGDWCFDKRLQLLPQESAWIVAMKDLAEEVPTGMKTVLVCGTCGSAKVFKDAYSAMNWDEVRTFDDCYCDACQDECWPVEVKVPDGTDVENYVHPLSDIHPHRGETND